jgi:predicted phage-related endonuclease
MEWVFGGLTVGCLVFLAKILLDFSHQAAEWHAKVRQADADKNAAEAHVGSFAKAKEESLARIAGIEAELQTMENMKVELKNKIEDLKRDHAKKGKIILHRQGPQEG